MSAAKSSFTPGPWEVISTDKEVYDGVHVADMSNNLLVIAEAEVCCPVADAHLIAASPELLAACKLFIKYEESADSDDGVTMMLAYNAAHDAIRAAVAKAEGLAV